MTSQPDTYEVVPSAARLATTLRDVGYDFKAAIADLVDNSIAAKATRVDITPRFSEGDSWIRISDNGKGMSSGTLNEALRYGSQRERYEPNELGKFGLGLKTASHSQCLRLTVATKQYGSQQIEAREHNLDHFIETDRWEIKAIPSDQQTRLLTQPLQQLRSGTVVLWQNLDRLLSYKDPSGRWAKKGFLRRVEELDQYLGMVFHRFLAGEIFGSPKLRIYIGKSEVELWDPFCRDEPHTEELLTEEFDVLLDNRRGKAVFTPFVLPNIHKFSTRDAHKRAGRGRWTASQGLWIYRADRLIQDGGWSNLRTADEHTKYVRAALDFYPDMDDAFGINIAKMRVSLPRDLRGGLKGPITRVTKRAKELYKAGDKPTPTAQPSKKRRQSSRITGRGTGSANTKTSGMILRISQSLRRSASNVGETEALDKIKRELKHIDKESADALGW